MNPRKDDLARQRRECVENEQRRDAAQRHAYVDQAKRHAAEMDAIIAEFGGENDPRVQQAYQDLLKTYNHPYPFAAIKTDVVQMLHASFGKPAQAGEQQNLLNGV